MYVLLEQSVRVRASACVCVCWYCRNSRTCFPTKCCYCCCCCCCCCCCIERGCALYEIGKREERAQAGKLHNVSQNLGCVVVVAVNGKKEIGKKSEQVSK
ncbi:hypothetical protein GQ42DRAFT_79759 [Ramicandelaber brevisporus]|nr:hypothetical protein GQ42DRAFT_79759 [Ramicandelaber brevisporus]